MGSCLKICSEQSTQLLQKVNKSHLAYVLALICIASAITCFTLARHSATNRMKFIAGGALGTGIAIALLLLGCCCCKKQATKKHPPEGFTPVKHGGVLFGWRSPTGGFLSAPNIPPHRPDELGRSFDDDVPVEVALALVNGGVRPDGVDEETWARFTAPLPGGEELRGASDSRFLTEPVTQAPTRADFARATQAQGLSTRAWPQDANRVAPLHSNGQEAGVIVAMQPAPYDPELDRRYGKPAVPFRQ